MERITFNDPPLARGVDIELAAADQMTLFVTRNAYNDLAYCRRHGWCWFCGERPAERVEAPLVPMCPECKSRREVRE